MPYCRNVCALCWHKPPQRIPEEQRPGRDLGPLNSLFSFISSFQLTFAANSPGRFVATFDFERGVIQET